jgi:predicted permease
MALIRWREESIVGTPLQWIEVAFITLMFCSWMLYIQMREKKADKKPLLSSIIFGNMKDFDSEKPKISVPQLVIDSLPGWVLAMGTVFGVRALAWPLLALLLGLPVAAFVGVGFLLRSQKHHIANSHSSPQ